MCLYPKLLKNPKYKPNKKNNGSPPICIDERTLYVPVGCGKCIECLKQKARQWQVRLTEDIITNKNAKFITLTFNEESLNKIISQAKYELINETEQNEIATFAVRKFLERWRKKYKKSVRHWLVTELGHNGTERIHLHGFIWTNEQIEPIWSYGWVYVGEYVNEKTINYCIKYVHKLDAKHKGFTPKVLTSPGIGANYLNRIDATHNKFNGTNTQEYYKTKAGIKLNLPIYYRNKLYTDEQKEQLWINKLDKNERWVCGERIDISKSEDDYYQTLEHYRKKNKRLGYGDNSKEWSKEQYKESRKNLKKYDKSHK